tara:strand:- start:200 stop:2944 length:2745 start_codon:yes stop_codon:yes gene_type:complete
MPYSLTRINRNIDAYLSDKPLEKRPGFQLGGIPQFVQPGPGRQGYSGLINNFIKLLENAKYPKTDIDKLVEKFSKLFKSQQEATIKHFPDLVIHHRKNPLYGPPLTQEQRRAVGHRYQYRKKTGASLGGDITYQGKTVFVKGGLDSSITEITAWQKGFNDLAAWEKNPTVDNWFKVFSRGKGKTTRFSNHLRNYFQGDLKEVPFPLRATIKKIADSIDPKTINFIKNNLTTDLMNIQKAKAGSQAAELVNMERINALLPKINEVFTNNSKASLKEIAESMYPKFKTFTNIKKEKILNEISLAVPAYLKALVGGRPHFQFKVKEIPPNVKEISKHIKNNLYFGHVYQGAALRAIRRQIADNANEVQEFYGATTETLIRKLRKDLKTKDTHIDELFGVSATFDTALAGYLPFVQPLKSASNDFKKTLDNRFSSTLDEIKNATSKSEQNELKRAWNKDYIPTFKDNFMAKFFPDLKKGSAEYRKKQAEVFKNMELPTFVLNNEVVKYGTLTLRDHSDVIKKFMPHFGDLPPKAQQNIIDAYNKHNILLKTNAKTLGTYQREIEHARQNISKITNPQLREAAWATALSTLGVGAGGVALSSPVGMGNTEGFKEAKSQWDDIVSRKSRRFLEELPVKTGAAITGLLHLLHPGVRAGAAKGLGLFAGAVPAAALAYYFNKGKDPTDAFFDPINWTYPMWLSSAQRAASGFKGKFGQQAAKWIAGGLTPKAVSTLTRASIPGLALTSAYQLAKWQFDEDQFRKSLSPEELEAWRNKYEKKTSEEMQATPGDRRGVKIREGWSELNKSLRDRFAGQQEEYQASLEERRSNEEGLLGLARLPLKKEPYTGFIDQEETQTNGDSDTWTINVDPTKEDALEYNMIGGYSGGGIPTLARRPNAIPPKRGPVPYGQNIKEGIVSLIK